MHKIKLTILVLLATFGIASFGVAQTSNPYTWNRVVVNSTSSPTQILAPNPMTGLVINEESAGTVNVLAFTYSGNVVPSAVPSACASPTTSLQQGKGCIEITPTKPFSDNKVCESPNCDLAGQGWAAVVEASGSATLDTGYRGTAP